MTGTERLPVKPLALSEQQAAKIISLVKSVHEQDIAVKSQLASVQQQLIKAYANYELDNNSITALQKEVISLQMKLLQNYHRLQLELRKIAGPKNYARIKHRVDLLRQTEEATVNSSPESGTSKDQATEAKQPKP